jgi:hypothetical protein
VIVLNVGGGGNRWLPDIYAGWTQHVLDIDPEVRPEVLMDCREMSMLDRQTYDAVFCSHNLEHVYRHEVKQVLSGMLHVLKEDGWAQIMVPDLQTLLEQCRADDLDAVWYQAPSGPVTFHDVLYGWGLAIGAGNTYFAHKCGFTSASLAMEVIGAGFAACHITRSNIDLVAFAFKTTPDEAKLSSLGIAC